jgi:phosphoenolpyruvate carboxykinase (GTP)
MKEGTPAIDWRGQPYDPKNGPAAHPNSRFTVSAKQNPAYTTAAEDPQGVPISAILFGGRRREVAPLVYEARNWAHGVLVGAGMASETTAAATGAVGVVRRDSMAMKPFCGYNYGDYWQHWLSFEQRSSKLPKIFHVNWFRQDKDNNFMWPGFGDNLRVLSWIFDRCDGKAGAQESAIGYLPKVEDLNTAGLQIQPETLKELLSINTDQWRTEVTQIGEYLDEFGTRTPAALREQLSDVQKRLA